VDSFNGGIAVLGKDLRELEGKRDALAHAFDLDFAVLFDDELGKEEALVESAGLADSVDLVFVEFGLL
jgi:hypothetical protein